MIYLVAQLCIDTSYDCAVRIKYLHWLNDYCLTSSKQYFSYMYIQEKNKFNNQDSHYFQITTLTIYNHYVEMRSPTTASGKVWRFGRDENLVFFNMQGALHYPHLLHVSSSYFFHYLDFSHHLLLFLFMVSLLCDISGTFFKIHIHRN